MEKQPKITHIFYASDSTVAQKSYKAYPETGIGQMLPLFLSPDVKVENHAINGRSTKSFMDQGRLKRIDDEIRKGDFLFIQFGHNDEKSQDPSRYTDAFTSFKANLKTYIKVARKHKAVPVLISPIERRGFDENGILVFSHGNYVRAMKDVAEEENVAFIDMTYITGMAIEAAGQEESRQWYMNFDAGVWENFPEGKADNTHLTFTGAKLYAEMLSEELRKKGGIYEKLLFKEEAK